MGPFDAFLSTLGSLKNSIGDYVRPSLEQLGLLKPPPVVSPLPDGYVPPTPTPTPSPRQFIPNFPQSLEAPLAQAQSPSISSLLLSAIAKQENRNFATDAVNPKSGAAGSFQLTPITLDELQRKGFNQGNRVDPLDPYQSASGASFYLASLLERFGGDLSLALAAYNAGPGNVQKYGGIPPFPETQNYVQSVLGMIGGE